MGSPTTSLPTEFSPSPHAPASMFSPNLTMTESDVCGHTKQKSPPDIPTNGLTEGNPMILHSSTRLQSKATGPHIPPKTRKTRPLSQVLCKRAHHLSKLFGYGVYWGRGRPFGSLMLLWSLGTGSPTDLGCRSMSRTSHTSQEELNPVTRVLSAGGSQVCDL